MKRAYLLLDQSYSRAWKKDHKKIVQETIALTLTNYLKAKQLYNKVITISVTGSNNAKIQKINHQYRNQNKATNILSFENLDWEIPLLSEQLEGDSLYLLQEKSVEILPNLPEGLPVLDLGSMVLSLEKIEEESQARTKPFLQYLSFITVHGLLHLLGFDHEEDAEALVMSRAEKKVMRKISSILTLNQL